LTSLISRLLNTESNTKVIERKGRRRKRARRRKRRNFAGILIPAE
jgi:hypothetical protein